MSYENFKEKYKSFLSNQSSNLLEESLKLKEEQRDDEYRFNRVENNIIEIFTQMFDISLKKVKDTLNWKTELEIVYLSFFEKIPTAWHTNLQNCINHGLHEEVHIENLKINRAESLKQTFKVMLEEEKV